MTATSAGRMRDWTVPALLSFGFRPFFLLGAIWAALVMGIWISMLTGSFHLPTRFDPVSWHAHEFLFGYLGAIVAGFLLTAVPNRTGRLPVVGRQLAGLVMLWGMGRLAVAMSAPMPAMLAAAIDLAFPIVFGALVLREIVAGRNWRNLAVLAMLAVAAAPEAAMTPYGLSAVLWIIAFAGFAVFYGPMLMRPNPNRGA